MYDVMLPRMNTITRHNRLSDATHSKVTATYTGVPLIIPWYTAAPVLLSGSPCMLRPHTSGGWC